MKLRCLQAPWPPVPWGWAATLPSSENSPSVNGELPDSVASFPLRILLRDTRRLQSATPKADRTQE